MIYVESYILIITVQGIGCLVSDCYSSSSEVVKIMGTEFTDILHSYSITKLFVIVESFSFVLKAFDLYHNYVDVTFKINHFYNTVDV